jgi:hypothetical protein
LNPGAAPERRQHRVDSSQVGAQLLGRAAEADPQEPVHAELVARDHQQALLVAQALHQARRVDRPRIPGKREGSGARGDETESSAVAREPGRQHGQRRVHDAARAL